MAICKGCGDPIEWGYDHVTGRWIPLEPEATDSKLDKAFVDENGVLRADHRERCLGGPGGAVNVTRLSKKVPGEGSNRKRRPRSA